jgi:hypothetical protein
MTRLDEATLIPSKSDRRHENSAAVSANTMPSRSDIC